MIVVQLMGGLGNQMFQYSLGRRLARERGVPLKLDLSWFRAAETIGVDTIREYALDGWKIEASIATAEDLARVAGPKGLLARLSRSRLARENGFGFDASVLRAPAEAYLTGYWQSEKYFSSIRDCLLAEFTLATGLCAHAEPLIASASEPSAVAIHVRRGDFARNARTNEYHGLCSIEYYLEAARRVAERVSHPTFYVFSDDPEWVRKNLKLRWPSTLVTHEGDCIPHQDMWLMSRCSHHIIANSSFSWWGAWLCPKEDKTVIAPKQWFRDPRIDTRDLIPESWTRI